MRLGERARQHLRFPSVGRAQRLSDKFVGGTVAHRIIAHTLPAFYPTRRCSVSAAMYEKVKGFACGPC